MKMNYVAALGIVLILGGGALYFFERGALSPSGGSNRAEHTLSYTNPTYGLAFTYPDTYELTERDEEGSALRAWHTIVLIRKEDLPMPEGGEGPPAITISLHENDLDHYTTEEWIRNVSASNYKLGDGTLASTTISGLPALSYRWDGLYQGTTIALAQPSWVYALTVTYLEMGAPIVQDFVQIRDSVRLSSVVP